MDTHSFYITVRPYVGIDINTKKTNINKFL